MAQKQQAQFQVDENFQSKLPFKVTPSKLEGVHLHPTPPDDFDVNKATQAELTEQGLLWRKPTKADHPLVHAMWNRFFSHKWDPKNRIVPEFEIKTGQSHNHRGKAAKQSDTSYLDNAWAGAGTNKGTWTSVIGSWNVPWVGVPPEAQGNEGGWNSSSWLGIDGMFTSDDVLQAGVQQHVDTNGNASYVAWFEWYAPPVPSSPSYVWQTDITNFAVSPGDTAYCSVQYVGTPASSGSVSFANETTGQHFSISLAPPPGATFNGSSVEWIMEAPDGGEPTSSLPYFTPVMFNGAIACNLNDNATIIPGNCDTMNIRNAKGEVLTNTTVNGETATITFIG